MAHFFRSLTLALGAAGVCSIAVAKLPPPSPEAAAKAAEAAAKSAWAGKVDAYKLCMVQDRLAARYRSPAAGAAATPPAACINPGPFAYTPPEAKPIEASGAHSPPGTATSPPSNAAPAAPTPAPKS